MALEEKASALAPDSYPWWPKSVCDLIAHGEVTVLGWGRPERVVEALAGLKTADVPFFLTELFPDELPEAAPPDLRQFFVDRACFVPPLIEPRVDEAAPVERWLALRDPAEPLEPVPGTKFLIGLARAGIVEWLLPGPEALAGPAPSGVAGVFGLSNRPQTMHAFSAWATALGAPFSCVGVLPGSSLRWLAHGLALPSESAPLAENDKPPLRAFFGGLKHLAGGRDSQRLPRPLEPTSRAVVEALIGTQKGFAEALAALPLSLRESCRELSWWWDAACRRALPARTVLERVRFDQRLFEEAREAGWLAASADAPDQLEQTWVRRICREIAVLPPDAEWMQQFAAFDGTSRAWRAAVAAVAGCDSGVATRRLEFARAAAAGWLHQYFQRAPGPLDETDQAMLEGALRVLPRPREKAVDPDGSIRTQFLGLLGRWREMKDIQTEPVHIARGLLLSMETRFALLESKSASSAVQADFSAMAAWLREREARQPTPPGAMALAILGLHGVEHGWAEAEITAAFAGEELPMLQALWAAIFAWLAGREEFGRHLSQACLSRKPATSIESWLLGVASSLNGNVQQGQVLFDRLEQECPDFFDERQPQKYRWFLGSLAWAAIGADGRAKELLAVALRLDRNAPARRMHFARTRVASLMRD